MDAYRTEDEQVEALKNWLKRNGMSTVLSIAIALALFFAWQTWQSRQQQQAEAASVTYQQLLQVSLQVEQEAGEAQYATATHLVDTLKDDFGKTTYAQYGALVQARLLTMQGKLEDAESELRWVLDTDVDDWMRQLVTLRLARLLFARGETDQAMALSGDHLDGPLGAGYYELRGDIGSKLGDFEGARENYQRSLDQNADNPNANPLVRMKLESLPVQAETEVAAQSE